MAVEIIEGPTEEGGVRTSVYYCDAETWDPMPKETATLAIRSIMDEQGAIIAEVFAPGPGVTDHPGSQESLGKQGAHPRESSM